MKARKYLEANNGNLYIEIDSDVVDRLGWGLGDELTIDVEEVWEYNHTTHKCRIKNVSKESFDRLMGAISPSNTSPNRE